MFNAKFYGSKANPNKIAIADDPPYEIKGKAIPVTGMIPMFIPRLIIVCDTKQVRMPKQ